MKKVVIGAVVFLYALLAIFIIDVMRNDGLKEDDGYILTIDMEENSKIKITYGVDDDFYIKVKSPINLKSLTLSVEIYDDENNIIYYGDKNFQSLNKDKQYKFNYNLSKDVVFKIKKAEINIVKYH